MSVAKPERMGLGKIRTTRDTSGAAPAGRGGASSAAGGVSGAAAASETYAVSPLVARPILEPFEIRDGSPHP